MTSLVTRLLFRNAHVHVLEHTGTCQQPAAGKRDALQHVSLPSVAQRSRDLQVHTLLHNSVLLLGGP